MNNPKDGRHNPGVNKAQSADLGEELEQLGVAGEQLGSSWEQLESCF